MRSVAPVAVGTGASGRGLLPAKPSLVPVFVRFHGRVLDFDLVDSFLVEKTNIDYLSNGKYVAGPRDVSPNLVLCIG